MKKLGRVTAILLITVFSLTLAAASAFAGCCDEDRPSSAPFGVAVSSDAPGIKLPGVLSIHHMDVYLTPDPDNPGESLTVSTESIVTLRLNKGDKSVEIFKTVVEEGMDISSAERVQEVIHDILAPEILEEFFDGDPSLRVVLKSIDKLKRTVPITDPADPNYDEQEADELYILADVVVAATKKE